MRSRSRWLRSPSATVAPEPAGGYEAALIVGGSLLVAGVVGFAVLSGRSASPMTWYLARSSGIAMYLLLWASYLLGLALAVGWPRGAGRATAHSLHGFATRLAYGFLALHVLSLVADPFVDFGLAEVAVPFASGVREPWTGLGVVATWLLLGIGASVGMRRAIGYPVWKALHWLTYPLFLLALAHGVGAGTDTAAPWAQAMYLLTGAAALSFTVYRILRGGWRRSLPQPGSPAGRLGWRSSGVSPKPQV